MTVISPYGFKSIVSAIAVLVINLHIHSHGGILSNPGCARSTDLYYKIPYSALFWIDHGEKLGVFGLVIDKYRNCSKTKIREHCQITAQRHRVLNVNALRHPTRQKLVRNYCALLGLPNTPKLFPMVVPSFTWMVNKVWVLTLTN